MEPTGSFMDDPNLTDKRFPGNPTKSYCSREPLRSTNAVACRHQIVPRRTHVIRIFPHEASLLRLLTALAIEQNDRWRRARLIVAPTFIEAEGAMRRTA